MMAIKEATVDAISDESNMIKELQDKINTTKHLLNQISNFVICDHSLKIICAFCTLRCSDQ